jgi:glycine cleavage system H lipoate-binding protein
MTCPFLREAQVRYCQTAAVRKLIPITPLGQAEEKCSSPEHVNCSVFHAQGVEAAVSGMCPFLAESLMQYCGAAPVTKMIPYSESQLSRCGCDRFRYCELYLAMAHPGVPMDDVDGIALPEQLRYSANHMWLDIGEDGICHAGIDGFLSRVFGGVERISYVAHRGQHRPTAIVTVNGIDHQIVFPNSFVVTSCNLYLRANPSRLTAEPYTGGWLFEGIPAADTTANLFQGGPARLWMEREQHRINEFLQQESGTGSQLAADGGLFTQGLARHLDRDRMLALFHIFFSPFAGGNSPLGKS